MFTALDARVTLAGTLLIRSLTLAPSDTDSKSSLQNAGFAPSVSLRLSTAHHQSLAALTMANVSCMVVAPPGTTIGTSMFWFVLSAL